MFFRPFLTTLLLALTATSASGYEMRTWTAMNGKTTEAAYVRYESDTMKVVMQKRDGSIIKVDRDSLCDEDWIYVMQYDPSIFSLWIKLGEPTAQEIQALKEGKLPRVYTGDPYPRDSCFISTDGRMCFQSSRESRSFSCTIPIDKSCFLPPRYGDNESFSIYRDKATGQLLKFRLEEFVNSEKAEWLYSIWVRQERHRLPRAQVRNIQYRAVTRKVASLIMNSRSSLIRHSGETTPLMFEPPSGSIPRVKDKIALTIGEWPVLSKSGDENDIEEFLIPMPTGQRICFIRNEQYFNIPRFNRILGILESKNRGVPRGTPLPQKTIEESRLRSTGSGFFITVDGYFLTNYHVVQGSNRIRLKTASGGLAAKVVRVDPEVDLALLKTERPGMLPITFAADDSATLGEDIFTIGFPMPDLQGFSPKMTKGVISSLNGIQDDDVQYQIDASIQPGNSGGPLVNNQGELVGVVVASLKAGLVAEKKGVLPQNVNYAIKKKHVLDFLSQVPDCYNAIIITQRPATGKSATPETIEDVQESCAMVVVFE